MDHRTQTKLIPLIRQQWRLYLLATCAASTAQVVGIPLALLTRKMVNMVAHERDMALDPAQIERTLWILGGLLVGLTLVRGISRWIRGVLGELFAQRIIADIRKGMLAHIHRLPMGYFDKRAAGKIVIRFVGDAQGLRSWLAIKLVSIPADVITVIGVLIAVGLIHLHLLYALVLPPLLLLPVLLIVNPRAKRWTRTARREQARLTGDLTDRITIFAALKASNAQQASIDPLKARIDAIAGAFVRRSYLDAWGQAVALTVGSLSLCAIGIWGSLLILHDQATTGDIVGAIWLSVLIRSPINRLTSTNIAYHRVRVAFDRIDALLNRAPEPGWDDGLLPYTGSGMRIRLKNLGFRNQHGRWVIRDLTATLTGPGCVVVRGDGDSTRALFELILRIRRPHEGRVGLDGVQARKLRVADIRSHIGWVDERRSIVPATLLAHGIDQINAYKESTAMISSHWATDDELRRLKELDQHTRITGGAGLRVALACAMLNDPPIVLIDQPEAGLTRAEVEGFKQWVERESAHRLVIVATNKRWIKPLAIKAIRIGQ